MKKTKYIIKTIAFVMCIALLMTTINLPSLSIEAEAASATQVEETSSEAPQMCAAVVQEEEAELLGDSAEVIPINPSPTGIVFLCKHDWENGKCTKCKKECTHNYDSFGECTICGYECTHESYDDDGKCNKCRIDKSSVHQHNWENGQCTECSKVCSHLSYIDGKCKKCGKECAHESYEGGYCKVCRMACTHPTHNSYGKCGRCDVTVSHNYSDGFCTVCGIECQHVFWSNGKCWECNKECSHPSRDSDGKCTVCGACSHPSWSNGKCSKCGYGCSHPFGDNGVCIKCGYACSHPSWSNGKCSKCGYTCSHAFGHTGVCFKCGYECSHPSWSNGVCSECGYRCTHDIYIWGGKCMVCGKCLHNSYSEGKCSKCGYACSHPSWRDGKCAQCGSECSHPSYSNGKCTVCGKNEHEPDKVDQISLTLSSGLIGVNFYFSSLEQYADTGAYVLLNDKKYEISRVEAGSPYVYTAYINAKEMGDKIKVALYDKDNKLIELGNEDATNGILYYSAYDYMQSVSSGDTKEFVAAMKNYGLCAQYYFGYNAPASLPDISAVSDYTDYMVAPTGTLPAGVKYAGSSLILNSSTTVRHYFRVDADAEVTFTVDNLAIEPEKAGKLCYIDVTDINAVDLSNAHVLGVSDENSTYTMSYSALTYCGKVKESSKDATLKTLVDSLYWYNSAAKAYFENN